MDESYVKSEICFEKFEFCLVSRASHLYINYIDAYDLHHKSSQYCHLTAGTLEIDTIKIKMRAKTGKFVVL